MQNILSNYSSHPIRAWIIRQGIDRPFLTIALSLFATTFIALGLRFFTIDDDLMKMIPKNLDSRISWDAVQEEFGSTEIIFIAFGNDGDDVFNPKALGLLWDLSVELGHSQKVEDLTSISTASRMESDDGFLSIEDLQAGRNVTQIEADNIKRYLDKNPSIRKRMASDENDYLFLMVQPYESTGLDGFAIEVKEITDRVLQGYDIHFGGNAYVTGVMPSLIREDVQGLMQAGLLIMILVLLANLRSFPAVGMVMMVIILSLISTLGFMGWMLQITGSDKFLFTLANTSMPIILLTIANSDGVHVMTKFFKEMRLRKNQTSSLSATMDSLLIPIFLTSITTVAAFLSMTTSPLEPLIGYGITISFGILWAWVLSSTLLPAVISLKKWNPNSKAFTSKSIFEKVIAKLGNVVLTHPKYVFSTGLLIVMIGLFGLFKVSVDVNMAKFFRPGTEIRDSMDFMDEKMTGTVDIRVRIEGDMKNPETLNDMADIQEFMESKDKISTSFSIANVVEQMHRTLMDDDPAFKTIPKSREKVNNLFTMYSMSGDPEDFSTMIDYDYRIGLITAFSKMMSTDEIFEFNKACEAFITKTIDPSNKIDVTGMMVVFRDLIILIIRSTIFSIIFSLVIIGVIASVFFKRILWGSLAVIPLTSAVIINFGFMGYFGIELSHITAILSSIIIGVGVDFAIHYIAQFRRLSRTIDQSKLSREVVDDVGYPIILDAASNMGFGALLFSAFVPIQYIGGLMVFAMVSTSLGTLTVLSALAELMKKKLVERKV